MKFHGRASDMPFLALVTEPEEKGIMQRPPEIIFAHGMWQHIIWAGLAIGAVSLFAQKRGQSTSSQRIGRQCADAVADGACTGDSIRAQLNLIFSTTPLTVQELMLCLTLSTIVFFVVELEKLLVRKGRLYAQAS